VRELCVFARQDITRDPPFSKIDLIVCRNVLIYLGPNLQRRLMAVFHYALKPTGFLMLGEVETVGASGDLFSIIDKKHKLYRRRPQELPGRMDFTLRSPEALPPGRETAAPFPEAAVQQRASRLLLDRYSPPAVVVNDDLEIVHTRGRTGAFLELPTGGATLHVLKMAREGIGLVLRNALQAARKSQSRVRRERLAVAVDGDSIALNLEVLPFKEPQLGQHFLVVFEPVEAPRPSAATGRTRGVRALRSGAAPGEDAHLRQLQRELEASREHMQSMIQDLEAANEELQSANEEILSSNEELQSTNEELDTAREELQSTNEEINTVNEELHARNDELIRANSDMINLLASVQIAIVIVSRDLSIRRFTPMAERVLNLIGTDVGRPIGHIKPNIDFPDLEQRILEVIESVTPYEAQVRDSQGNWYSMRIRPYKDLDNRIDGAVLALFDIDSDVRLAQQLGELRSLLDSLLHVVREPVVVLDDQLRITRLGQGFAEVFGLEPRDSEGRSLAELGDGAWRSPELAGFLEKLRAEQSERVELAEVPLPGYGRACLRARRIALGGQPALYVISLELLAAGGGDARH
jgi:two-component system CheB/CheR fusion protein